MAREPQLITSLDAMQQRAREHIRSDQTVGLVPTMGALHAGHLKLIERARSECDVVVVSIFVNPTQFGPGEDYDTYPRDLGRDLAQLADHRVDAVFNPEPRELYPRGFATHVEVEGLTEGLCGAFRPGHFRGVTTVVTKLFNATRPHLAVFGRKDYQQAAVIRRMVRDLDMGIEILLAPTVREPDGLAMSSRNVNLTAGERRRAPALFGALSEARQRIEAGETDAGALVADIRRRIAVELSERIDYVEIVDPETLERAETVAGPVVALAAVRVGKVRLIDNVEAAPRAG
jgi:pantoate--beta-alanine ligase